jgi:hypothetical protein
MMNLHNNPLSGSSRHIQCPNSAKSHRFLRSPLVHSTWSDPPTPEIV